jgi:HCOMODA/2-hydroxy-3-carboxy-muconic semialdehyde decarboxylase
MRLAAQDVAPPDLRVEIADAARALAALDLVTAFGHVSARDGERMLVTPAAPLDEVRAGDLVAVPLDTTTLPAGAPAESWLHLAVYAARPDVSAIARAQPPTAYAAAAASSALPTLYGQASWLGRTVPVHDDARLLRARDLAAAAARTLGGRDAVLLRGNGAATTATTPGLAVTRMWLLSGACHAWLAATAAGAVRALTDAEVDAWRAVQDELLPRLWRHLRRTALPEAETLPDPEASRG